MIKDFDEFIIVNNGIYKRVGEMGSMLKSCPHCGDKFFTKEQRKIYCSGACKTRAYRDRSN